MEIRQLRYFISVARHLNFTRAAQECFVVQTTMTHQIASLEKELGVRLFDRTKRSVSLTAEGEALLPEAEEIVRHADYSQDIMNRMKGNYIGVLRLGYWGNIVRRDLPGILASYRKKNPKIGISLKPDTADNLLDELEKGRKDVVFSCYFDVMEEMEWMNYEPLYEDPLCVVLPADHPLAGELTLTPEQLGDDPLVTFPGMGESDLRTRTTLTNRIAVTEETHDSIMIAVEAGYGVTIGGERTMYGATERVRIIPLVSPRSTVKVVACWNREKETPAVQELINTIRQYYREEQLQ